MPLTFRRVRRGHERRVFVFSKRSGERARVRFFPGCLLWSLVLSVVATVLLNLALRAC